MKKTTIKQLLFTFALLLGGASTAWGQAVTRTWDFTTGSWSTINASTGTVYYATDGTAKTSTEYDASTAVCMQVTNAFTYSSDHYAFGGHSTSTSSGYPDKDYISIVIPNGYTLTVNGALYYSNTYNNSFNIMVGEKVKVSNSTTTYTDLVYSNCSGVSVTAYIYTPSTNGGRYINIKSITLKNNAQESLTAINTNVSWDFTNKIYNATYDGAVLDNIFYGSGVQQKSNSALHFSNVNNTTGNTTTGEYTVQIKIPANKAIGLLFRAGGSNGRPTYLTDGTNTLATVNASNHEKDLPVSITSSESERTLYFYVGGSGYNSSYGYVKYINVYTQQSVSIGSTGWATLYTPCALDFSGVSGLKAYTATCNENTVTLTEVSNVPAGTGVILKGTPNKKYDIPAAGSSSTDKGHLTGAFFTATAFDAFADPAYTIYALTSENGGATVQFNPITSGEIAAGKAFLKISDGASALARSLNVVFADETTGIKNLTPTLSEGEKVVYNLQGRRVTQPTKGIYVHNGKKVIIK